MSPRAPVHEPSEVDILVRAIMLANRLSCQCESEVTRQVFEEAWAAGGSQAWAARVRSEMEARRIPLLRDTEVGAGLEEASAASRRYRFRQYAREVVWPAVREGGQSMAECAPRRPRSHAVPQFGQPRGRPAGGLGGARRFKRRS